MVAVLCSICKKSFHVKPSHLKRGDGKYCSNTCSAQARRRGKYVICSTCGKDVWRMPKHLAISKSGKFFCSKSCQTHWRNSVVYVGSRHPNWKGGEYIYRTLLSKTQGEKKCKRCGIEDFRLLTVHHIDENHQNNALNNLAWLCYNCHALVHKDKKEKDIFNGGHSEAVITALCGSAITGANPVGPPYKQYVKRTSKK